MKVTQNVQDPKFKEQHTSPDRKCQYSDIDYPKVSAHSITFINWKNKHGKEEIFRLNKLVCHKWDEIGRLLEIPHSQLIAWERGNQLKCTDTVLCHWLDNPTDRYPKSWEGLDRLLNDAELAEEAKDLKQALANAL